jgi:predicted dienelactone hydrolase
MYTIHAMYPNDGPVLMTVLSLPALALSYPDPPLLDPVEASTVRGEPTKDRSTKWPLVILSHGLGGSRTTSSHSARSWLRRDTSY